MTLLVGMQVGAASLEDSVEIPQEIKIELPYDPAIALLEIYPKDTDVVKRRAICTPTEMVYNSPLNTQLEESPFLLKIIDFRWMQWESNYKHALTSKA